MASLWLASCAPDAPRSSSGAIMDVGAWKDIDPDESQLKIATILGKKIDTYQRRSRDGGILDYLVRFDGRKGTIQVQYSASYYFRTHDSDAIRSRDEFQSRVLQATKASASDITEPVRLFPESLRYSRYGYFTVVKKRPGGRECLIARAGYNIGKVGPRSLQSEGYNAIVSFEYCNTAVSVDAFRKFFDELAVR